ncbi:unnamed protein product [Prorocentrum cordatum]|uniref:Uncharacterized protein n=1 Tax=Prorocentrum cordatum TaxID=2364126 RepID=A0ABN9STQ7_9DINO|nr:unnamed protein product [Polarella glacialis]
MHASDSAEAHREGDAERAHDGAGHAVAAGGTRPRARESSGAPVARYTQPSKIGWRGSVGLMTGYPGHTHPSRLEREGADKAEKHHRRRGRTGRMRAHGSRL